MQELQMAPSVTNRCLFEGGMRKGADQYKMKKSVCVCMKSPVSCSLREAWEIQLKLVKTWRLVKFEGLCLY